MKKIILILALIITAQLQTKAQQDNQFSVVKYQAAPGKQNSLTPSAYSLVSSGPDKDYDFYLRRSKNNRIIGWTTLGGGLLLSGIGLLIANGDYATNGVSDGAGVVTVAGAVLGIVSIPFMITASVYKHQAKMMIKNQKTGFGIPPNVSKDIVGITMTIPIGR